MYGPKRPEQGFRMQYGNIVFCRIARDLVSRNLITGHT